MRGKKLTSKQFDTFIEHLAQHGNVTIAAEAAGSDRRTFYEYRNAKGEDGQPTADALKFAARWDAVIKEAADRTEYEVYRRAVEGWDEPVFGRVGKDEDGQIGIIRRYSDAMLSLRIKALKPEYREKNADLIKYIDLSKLSDDQLKRLADGDDLLAVIANK